MDITGVALLLRRDALEQVGLFDESFFAYYEDRDLFVRLRRAGWRLKHVSSVRVAHKGSATAGAGSPFSHYWHNRNFVVLMRRHAGILHLLGVLPTWLKMTGWFVAQALRSRDREAILRWLGGYRDGVRAALADQPVRGPTLEPPDNAQSVSPSGVRPGQ